MVRAYFSVAITLFMMFLVPWQAATVNAVARSYLTVEGLTAIHRKGLSFDRHYGMVLDFAFIAPLIGLVVFLCAPQWTVWAGFDFALISIAIAILFGIFWYKLPTPEAHNQSIGAAGLHALYFAIALWAIGMLLFATPHPSPVLLLLLCMAIPAFLFVGQHMYLNLITLGQATTYPDAPLKNPIAWAVLIVGTGVVWWRAYALIPSEFWGSLG